jgi:transcriptional regulator with XRE-family HTH domain
MKLLSERLAYIYRQLPELEGDRGQIGLVKASGASKSMVNQWLSDKIKSIDILYALKIESAIGFSHIWLMTGLGEPLAKPGEAVTLVVEGAAEEPRLTLALPMELDLLDLFRRSTPRGQLDTMEAARIAEKMPVVKIRSHQA